MGFCWFSVLNAQGQESVSDGETTIVEVTEIEGSPLIDKLRKGGITVLILLALSVAGVSYTIERLINLKRFAIIPYGLIEDVEKSWAKGEFDKVVDLCEAKPSTAGRILETFAQYRDSSMAELQVLADDIAGRELRRHLQKAYPLAVIGAVAPLLGLMGTVFGMIESFEVVAIAGSLGDASILADGISKALVTTAVGLVVAVPMLVLYHYFKNRTTLFALTLEEEINEFMKDQMIKKAELVEVEA